jgi:hypothetical protein
MLKVIKLGLAERQIISAVLGRGGDGKIGTARIVRSLRHDLALREASRDIDEMIKAAQDAAATDRTVKVPDWDDILEDGTPVEYTVDDVNLIALRGWLDAVDWSKARGEGGKEVEMPVIPAMLEAVANTADAIADALAK